MVSLSLLVGLSFFKNIAFVVLIYCNPACMVSVMKSGISVIKYFQFLKWVADATKGGSLTSLPID